MIACTDKRSDYIYFLGK